ncbi:MAG: glycosyltransferase family 9 protein [Rhodospirillales bacterium]|nr:glycosyltransferase family 9 protein [Alphaproteobacteria bacterium]MBL6948418.1 glycosyltransferase family 9 protein [Rhodospirillales bacterium]
MDAETPSSVLVYVGFDRIGDGLLKLPFVRGLRQAFPNARITWLAGRDTSVYAGILSDVADGLIDEIIECAGIGDSPGEVLRGLPEPLKDRRFDLVIDTQRIFWTSLSLWRVPHRCFISPAARFLLSSRKPAKGYKFPKTMQRQLLDLLELASGREFPSPELLDLDIRPQLHDTAAHLLPDGPDYVGFAPGSGGPPKCWPLENFIRLAGRVAAQGRVPVFFLGPKEEGWLNEIKAAVPQALFPLQNEIAKGPAGPSPLLTIAMTKHLNAAVSNDSGTGHMFAVGGVPVVILYGVTRPSKFQPMTDRLSIIRAQDYGGSEMHHIPLEPVEKALTEILVG